MLILAGDAPSSSWSPRTRLRLSAQAERLLELVHHDDPLFREASARAISIAAEANDPEAREAQDEAREMLQADPMMSEVRLGGGHVQVAEFAALRLRAETRIASFSFAVSMTKRSVGNRGVKLLNKIRSFDFSGVFPLIMSTF